MDDPDPTIHLTFGFALTEELPTLGGFPATDRLRGIGVLRAPDMPAAGPGPWPAGWSVG